MIGCTAVNVFELWIFACNLKPYFSGKKKSLHQANYKLVNNETQTIRIGSKYNRRQRE